EGPVPILRRVEGFEEALDRPRPGRLDSHIVHNLPTWIAETVGPALCRPKEGWQVPCRQIWRLNTTEHAHIKDGISRHVLHHDGRGTVRILHRRRKRTLPLKPEDSCDCTVPGALKNMWGLYHTILLPSTVSPK